MDLKCLKYTAFLSWATWFKIPLIAFISPRVLELSNNRIIIKIPLGHKTKNHLGVMYFGALAIGAELSIALKAVEIIADEKLKVDFIFKDFKADFLKRGDGDVHFICDEVALVKEMILDASTHNNRLEKKFNAYAIVPTSGNEPIAKFELTLSLKNRRKI